MYADNLSAELAAYKIDGYNVYKLKTPRGCFVIGGLPQKYRDEYLTISEDAKGIILLTSKPEFSESLISVIEKNPDILIFASSAGLRNIKEIINASINESLVRDLSELDDLNIKFFITPGLHWVDTITVWFGGYLFTGELFSGCDGNSGLRDYFNDVLSVNKVFLKNAIDRFSVCDIKTICPAYGDVITGNDIGFAFEEYNQLCFDPVKDNKLAVIIYASRYGYTKKLAVAAEDKLRLTHDVKIFDVYRENKNDIINAVNNADMLLVGTHTIDRNAPKAIWDIITSIDLVNKREMKYWVFGSFGWAGDGIKLINSALASMGMRRMSKPFEVLFNPKSDIIDDFARLLEKLAKE